MARAAKCYTPDQLLVALNMPLSTFKRLRKKGKLPFLEELQPRLGRTPRYRAEPIDRYLDNAFAQARAQLHKVSG